MLRTQLKSAWPTLALVAVVSALLLGAVQLLQSRLGVSMGTLTQDPLFGREVYIGLLSQVGILLWAASSAVCLLAAYALRRGETQRRFFLAAGLVSLVLCLDDAFMLHDEVLPGLGLDEKIVYAAYVGLLLLFLLAFRARILKTDYLVLGVAFVFFAMSILADVREIPILDPFLLEDGAKTIGIVAWLAYFFRTSGLALRRSRAG